MSLGTKKREWLAGDWPLKTSAMVISVLTITAFAAVLTVLTSPNAVEKPVIGFSTSSSLSISIADSSWIINPGGTFTVNVVIINNENTPMENVDVHAYVFEGTNVLNVGGWQSNLTTINLDPNESENVALNITIKENATLGIYNLRARAKLSDETTYDATENILIENSGIHFKIGMASMICLSGSGVFVNATVANFTSDNFDEVKAFAHVYVDEQVVSENGWEGDNRTDNLYSGDIKNAYFVLKILENVDSGDYILRARVELPDNTFIDDDKPIRIVSINAIKQKLDLLENGIIKEAENFLNLYYVGRGKDNLIKINEVYANVEGTDEGNEWIEIYNTSQDNLGWAGVRIGNWKLVNNSGTLATVPMGKILQPDEYYVLEGVSGLNNGGDNVWLLNENDEIINWIEYTSTTEDKSIARLPNSSENVVIDSELTKNKNNDDNSNGNAYLPKIDLLGIATVASELRCLVIENARELMLANADIYDTLQFIQQNGSGVTSQDTERIVRYIQTYGQFPENFRQSLFDEGMTEDDIQRMESFIKDNSGVIITEAPYFGLNFVRSEYEKTIRALIDLAAASLHIEVAANIEHQLQDAGFNGDEYETELQNRWNIVNSDLNQANSYDNASCEALKAEDWQAAYDNSDNLMGFAENRAPEIVDEIHLARSARTYFGENGTSENVKLAADYELKFTKALDRFLYYYQKGLYFEMIMLAALNGDNEQALDEAANARDMSFTVDTGEQSWQPLKDAPGTANMAAENAQSNGVDYIYVARLYQHHLDRYRIDTDGWTATASLSENAWGWDAGVSLAYAENGGLSYIYALMGGDTQEFWRYNPTNNSWENLGFTPDFVSSGGSLVWTGGNVLYATRGKSSTDFWLYDIENNTWDSTTLALPPGVLETGAGLEWTGGDYLYTFKGGGSQSFYHYSISGNSWAPVTSAPAGVGAGASLEWVDPYVYATRGGGSIDFWRYNPSDDTWENSTPTPDTVGTRAGDRLVKYGDYLYLPRGEFDEQFWRFKPEERWVSVEELLSNPSKYDNKEVWVQGFMSNVQRQQTQNKVPYSLFDLTTNEGFGAGVDNTRYWIGENVDVTSSSGDIKLMGSPTDHVVISEVQTNSDEFVELYNPSSDSVNMTGWYWSYFPSTRVENDPYRNKQFPSGATIPSHGFYLISVYDDPYTSENYASIADWNIGYAGPQISNIEGAVGIYMENPATKTSPANAAAVCEDKVGWENAQVYEGSLAQTPDNGQSLERKARSTSTSASLGSGGADELLGNGYDSNNNSGDFVIRAASQSQNSSTVENPAFVTTGWLESSIYDAGVTVSWENVSWVETEPDGTSVTVEVRTGSTSIPDNSWTNWEGKLNDESIARSSRFIQYRINLFTDNSMITPTLHEIRTEYVNGAQTNEWMQSDWSGGDNVEFWSAQQRLRVYLGGRHIDVAEGAGENSYGTFRGIFYASHWVTGVPQLNMLNVKLDTNGDPVSTDTPTCWSIYAPWGVSGYVGSSSITRGWGGATYFAPELKEIREGALFAAFATFEAAMGEFAAWFDIFQAIVTIVVNVMVGFVTGGVVGAVVGLGVGILEVAFPYAMAGPERQYGWTPTQMFAGEVKSSNNEAKSMEYYEDHYSWKDGMSNHYDWDDYDYEYGGYEGYEGYEGMDGYDAGC
jgi:hypothetical protein